MTNNTLEQCFTSIGKYLRENGWKPNELNISQNWMFWKDPLCEDLLYRLDHAFTIQSDRDAWESVLRKDYLKRQNNIDDGKNI